jgi:hypothetical protein
MERPEMETIGAGLVPNPEPMPAVRKSPIKTHWTIARLWTCVVLAFEIGPTPTPVPAWQAKWKEPLTIKSRSIKEKPPFTSPDLILVAAEPLMRNVPLHISRLRGRPSTESRTNTAISNEPGMRIS